MLEVRWHPIDKGTYSAILSKFGTGLMPFATHTCMDGCEFHAETNFMTEWGFRDAPCPLIKSHMRGERGTPSERWEYWIAEPIEEEGDE